MTPDNEDEKNSDPSSSGGDKPNSPEDKKKNPDDRKDQGGKEDRQRRSKGPLALIILGILVVIGGVAGLIWWLHARHYESTDDAFIDGHIVAVSPQVSAYVKRVLIDDNYHVKVGQVLVELDDRDYRSAQLQAEGNYDAAVGKLDEAGTQISVSQANVGQAEAQLTVAQTNALNAQQDLDRYLALDPRARSKQQLDNATDAQRSTSAQVRNAMAQVAAAQAQLQNAQKAVETAQGNVEAAKGALDQANTNLGYCTIRAESDGAITRKNVEPGMYVQVDEPLFQIVTYDVWVVANLKETQLQHVWPGQSVEISVDAYPGRELTGKVESIQNGSGSRFSLLPAENATGNYVKIVQRVPVKIDLDKGENDDMEHLLSPGMSVEPDIKVR